MTWIDRFVDLRDSHAERATDAIEAAVRSQVAKALVLVKERKPISIDPAPLEDAIRRASIPAFREVYAASMQHFGPDAKAAGFIGEEELLRYLQSVGLLKVRVANDNTRRMLLRAVLDGLAAGEDVYDISDRLYKEWVVNKKPGDGPVTRARTEIIARTEIGAAANAGGLAGASAVGMTHKVWTSIRDSRTRVESQRGYDHFQAWTPDGGGADGQRRLIHEPFTISGEQLMFPGDTSLGASVGNVANCRCAVDYEYQR